MKKISIFLLFTLQFLFGSSLNGQTTEIPCGTDYLRALNDSDSISKVNFDSVRLSLWNQLNSHSVVFPNTYTIPVVVHVVGSIVNSAVTDAEIIQQINRLNDAFANSLGSTNPVANDIQVQFCLAQTLPDGSAWSNISTYNPTLSYTGTAGITRCITTAADNVSNNHVMDPTGPNSQQALTQVVYFNPNNYLNIWITNAISLPGSTANNVLGYSPYPLLTGISGGQFLDGIVMRLDAFGNPSANANYGTGLTLAHEAGHYLFLYHTFQNSCVEVSGALPCNALGSGDECCDTPPVSAPNQNNCFPNNSCSESPNLPDQIENYMDYAYDILGCRNTFTTDQAIRMRDAIVTFRSNLVSYPNLIVTGINCISSSGLNPTFVTNQPNGSTQFCTGLPYGYVTGPEPSGTTFSWIFNGGTPSTSTVASPTGIVYSSPGVYSTQLTVTDGSGSLTYSIQVFVSDCNPYIGTRANWYFGSTSAVSFAPGFAQPIFEPVSGIETAESGACISDNLGNTLFYTNGSYTWNMNNVRTPNGGFSTPMNGGPNAAGFFSASQGVVIVPRPGVLNRYYIYTKSDVPTGTTLNYGISQYEFDMTLDGGLGDLISNTPINPIENYAMTEPVLAIPHCNGTDYWIISKPVNNNQTGLLNPGPATFLSGGVPTPINKSIAAYLITNTGISGVPVLSNSGPFVPPSIYPAGNGWIGQIMVSPDKQLVVFTYESTLSSDGYVYKFDCATGTFNYLTSLTGIGYGGCFSPNSKIFYGNVNLSGGPKIRQFDLTNLSLCNTIVPFIDFDYYPPSTPTSQRPFPAGGTLQLGPDNKIYVTRPGGISNPQFKLGIINFPDQINTSTSSNECGYNFDGVFLLSATQRCRSDLPNDIIGTRSPMPDDFSFCVSNCSEACFTNLGCGVNFSWNFGDGHFVSGTFGTIPLGTDGGTTIGNFEYPCHTYATTGSFNVTLSIDGRPVVTYTVNIILPPTPTISGPNPVCSTSTLPESYFAPLGYNYSWTATNGTPTSGTLQTFNVTWTTFPATLSLTITDPANGCSSSTTITITQTSVPPVANAGADVDICSPGTTILNGTGLGSYQWTPLSSSLSCYTCPNPTSSAAATTTYTLTVANGCGSSSDNVTVTQDCGYCSYGTILTNTVTNIISSSPPSGGNYSINNINTIINGSVTFNACDVKIANNVKITVLPGSILTIKFSHFSACSKMWYGIEVQPGGQLIIGNSSLIEDAINAVVAKSSSTMVSSYLINSTTFNKNRISILVEPSLALPQTGTITNCVFTCRNISSVPLSTIVSGLKPLNALNSYTKVNLLSPYSSVRSVSALDVTDNLQVQFGVASTTNGNTVDNMDFGVYSRNSNVSVYNNVFENLTGNSFICPRAGTCFPVIGIAVCAIDASFDAMTPSTFNSIFIGGTGLQINTMSECYRGVDISNYVNMVVQGNLFTNIAGTTLPFGTPNQVGDHAIFIQNQFSQQLEVATNTINNYVTGVHLIRNSGGVPLSSNQNIIGNILSSLNANTPSNTGIFVEDGIPVAFATSAFGLFIQNNTVDQANTCIRARNISSGLKIIGNTPLKIRPSIATTTVNKSGIKVENCFLATIYLNQNITGTTTTLSNTRVKGIYIIKSPATIVTCNQIYNVGQSMVFEGGCNASTIRRNKMKDANDGFVLLNNGIVGPQGSPSSPPTLGQPSDNSWFGTFLNSQTLTFNTLAPNTHSVLYVRSGGTFTPSTNLTSPGVPGFDDYNASGALINTFGPFILCSSARLPTFNNNPIRKKIIQDLIDYDVFVDETKWLAKQQVFAELKEDTTLMAGEPILQNFYITHETSSYGKIESVVKNIQDGSLSSAQSINSSIVSTTVMEDNHKALNDIYLNFIVAYPDSIGEIELDVLNEIAIQCPLVGGDAVYQARAMINFLYHSSIYFNDSCDDEGSRSFDIRKDENQNSLICSDKFKLYPNPSDGNMSFEYSISNNDIAELLVYNPTGILIKRYDLNNKVDRLVISDMSLRNGVYLYSVVVNSNVEAKGKFVIIK